MSSKLIIGNLFFCLLLISFDARAYYCSNSDSINYGLSTSGLGCSLVSNEGSIAISSGESAIVASDFTIASGVVNAGLIDVNSGSGIRLLDGGFVDNGIRNTGTISSLYSDGIEINGDSGIDSASPIFINSPRASYYKGVAIYNSGTINANTMHSFLYSDNPSAIKIANNVTVNGDIVNDISGSISSYSNGIYVSNSIVDGAIVNQGSIGYNVGGVYVDHNSYVESIENYGTFTGGASGNKGIFLENDSSVGSIINSGIISATNGYAVYTAGAIGSVINSSGATMSGIGGIVMVGGNIYNLQNYGSITVTCVCSSTINVSAGASITNVYNAGIMSGRRYNVTNYDRIENFTNYGAITVDEGYSAIFNHKDLGSIGNLNNLQGAGSSAGALTICCKLPENYNIVINDFSNYGQLSAKGESGNIDGVVNFGIYPASTIAKGNYSSVLKGVYLDNLGQSSGDYNGFKWSLKEIDNALGIWDLVVTGAATEDTQNSLKLSLNSLENIYAMQASIINNDLNYDCWVFGKKNMCVQVGGRYTRLMPGHDSSAAAVLVTSYRTSEKSRIGLWIDQSLFSNSLIDNSNALVTLGNAPLFGLFAVWNKNKNNRGLEIKFNAAYGVRDLTLKRQVVGSSEAGSGTTSLNSRAASVVLSYNVAQDPILVATPYVGVRYTEIGFNDYTEKFSDDVTAPLAYKSLTTKSATILFGIKLLNHINLNRNLVVSAGVGGEHDLLNNNSSYIASGISGLTEIAFSGKFRTTRPVANFSSYYKINSKQRIGLDVFYRKEFFAKMSTISGVLSYTVGF